MDLKAGGKKSYQKEIEKCGLINISEVPVPGIEILFREGGIGGGSIDMLAAVLDNLGEDLAGDIWKRDDVIGTIVLDHVADGL